jgi:hypothetical protein
MKRPRPLGDTCRCVVIAAAAAVGGGCRREEAEGRLLVVNNVLSGSVQLALKVINVDVAPCICTAASARCAVSSRVLSREGTGKKEGDN